MSSRNAILNALRRNLPDAVPLPDLPTAVAPEGDLAERFTEAVAAVSGRVIPISADGLANTLTVHYPDATVICSAVPGLLPGTLSPHDVDDPHDLAGVDLYVCEGVLGVAANGAVWVDETRLGHRAAPFLTQHLALVLDRSALVATLPDAYARLAIDEAGYGVFIAGPSKTADIEQSLVIGAHGPRSLTVFLRVPP